jgi:aromatic ring-opening dioxygenase catalytic subunit (LigB family)
LAQVVGAFGTSHAYTFLEPDAWEKRREFSHGNYQRRFGTRVPDRPEIAGETLADNHRRYAAIRDGHARMRERVAALRPDVVVLIGDDQDENYTEENLPQFSIYLGEAFVACDRATRERRECRSAPALAWSIANAAVEAGIDLATSRSFAKGELLAHAHTEPIVKLLAGSPAAILPVFVNAIHVPAPTPARCLEFGRALRAAIDAFPGEARVMLAASGGFSHFTAGFPYPHYHGDLTFGAISVEFDRQVVEYLRNGDLDRLARLTNADLLAHGDVELRQWIVLCGALGAVKPEFVDYEPFFTGIQGMAVGYWGVKS